MDDVIFKMYTIKQVAEKFGVSDNTIRNWEKEFGKILNIQRDENGNRYYLESDIRKLREIEHLRSEGFGIAQIKKIFQIVKEAGEGDNEAGVSKEDFNSLKNLLINSQTTEPQNYVNREDFGTFQEKIVEAIGFQFNKNFEQVHIAFQNLNNRIKELEDRTQLLLESPEFKDDANNINERLTQIKGIYEQLNDSFQKSENTRIDEIEQQKQLMGEISKKLDERENQFNELVDRFRSEKEENHGFWGRISRAFSSKK